MDYVKKFYPAADVTGECPIWSSTENSLYWVDINSKKIKRWNPDSEEDCSEWDTPGFPSAIALRSKHPQSLLVIMNTGIHTIDLETQKWTLLCHPEQDKPCNRSNEGKCDAQGRLWFGTMTNNINPDGTQSGLVHEATGSLYVVNPDGSWEKRLSPVGIPNVMAWSPDGNTMYFGDTQTLEIAAYDYNKVTADINNKRVLSKVASPGRPDGATVDNEGFLWNARFSGSAALRFDTTTGEVVRSLALPATNVTSCTFDGNKYMYCTSATKFLDKEKVEANPYEGSVMQVDIGVVGPREPPFAG